MVFEGRRSEFCAGDEQLAASAEGVQDCQNANFAYCGAMQNVKGTRPAIPQTRLSSAIVAGLMSGTSADGIDAVVVRFQRAGSRTKAELIKHVHTSFPARLRQRILTACLHGSVSEICELNFVLGKQFARAAAQVITKSGVRTTQVAAIGSHGQTVHHLPNSNPPSTLQIGEPSIIAEITGIPVIADFRVRDMAAGGQGAPLVPYADWALLTDPQHPRIIQNIGGIGNLTLLPAKGRLEQVIAFDTGPGNMVIDAVTSAVTDGREKFDRNGRLASKGKIFEPLLRSCLKHPYLGRKPPKTTGREEFGEPFVQEFLKQARKARLGAADQVATATAFTAASIAKAYREFAFPQLEASGADLNKLQIIVGGGGAKNSTLMRMLGEAFPFGRVLTHEDIGMPNEAKEAVAFALLAFETLSGRPSNVPGATGAKHPAILGKIVLA